MLCCLHCCIVFFYYSAPSRGWEYCDQCVCMLVCMSVSIGLWRNHRGKLQIISKIEYILLQSIIYLSKIKLVTKRQITGRQAPSQTCKFWYTPSCGHRRSSTHMPTYGTNFRIMRFSHRYA